MKKLTLIAIMLLTLGACNYVAVEETNKECTTSRFVKVEDTGDYMVVYDKYTKVMYIISTGGYNRGTTTLLVDADGKPLIWDKNTMR